MSIVDKLTATYHELDRGTLESALNDALEWAAQQADSRDLCDHCRDAQYAAALIRAGKSTE